MEKRTNPIEKALVDAYFKAESQKWSAWEETNRRADALKERFAARRATYIRYDYEN